MTSQFKRLIFISSILAAIPFFASAQKSASATMQVQVTVLEGNSISQKGNSTINLTSPTAQSGTSELTTIILNNSNAASLVVDRPEVLSLLDDEGHNLRVPVNYTDRVEGKDMVSQANTQTLNVSDDIKGRYKGSFTTSVAYL